ncbi:MAG: hypothetical protein ABIR24_13660 [Verrucomicrobiota bacterium]
MKMNEAESHRSMELDKSGIEIWRESLAHLRHLSDEVWKRFQFFLWFDLALFVFALGIWRYSKRLSFLLFLAAFSVAVIGRYVLKRNRIYYLQMLARKSLLEEEFGFYASKFSGTEIDYAFPWRLAPGVVSEIKMDLDSWVKKSLRAQGTIALWQFLIYEALIGLACVLLLVLMISAS